MCVSVGKVIRPGSRAVISQQSSVCIISSMECIRRRAPKLFRRERMRVEVRNERLDTTYMEADHVRCRVTSVVCGTLGGEVICVGTVHRCWTRVTGTTQQCTRTTSITKYHILRVIACVSS